MTIVPAAEAAHEPAPGEWQEHWHVEVVAPTGFALYARLTLVPARGVAWWWTAVVAPDAAGPVLVRADDLTLPRPGTLEVRGDGVWADLVCETPLEHWSVGLEAFGVRLDSPVDALRDERGERLPVGLDLEWETAGPPIPLADGYAQLGTVHGDLLLGAATVPIDARGVRSHGWGAPRWQGADEPRLAACGTERLLVVDGSTCARWEAPAPSATTVAIARVEQHVDADLLPTAARVVLADGTELAVDVEGAAPVRVDAGAHTVAALHRAVARVQVRGPEADEQEPLAGWWERAAPL